MMGLANQIDHDEQTARARRRLLLAVCPAAFVSLLSTVSLNPFLAEIASDLGTTVSLVGQVSTVTMALATVLGLLVGPLSDHYGHRRFLLIGTLAVVGSGIIVALSPVLGVLFLAALTGALVRAIIVPVSYAIVSASLGAEAARQAISRMVVVIAGGILIGPPVLTTVGSHLGWRVAFVALALGGILATILAGRLLPYDAARNSPRPDLRSVLRSYVAIIRHRAILSLYGAALLRNTITWTVAIYLGAFLVLTHGLLLQEIGLAFTITGLGQLVGGFVFGGRIGRLPLRPLLGCIYLAHSMLFAALLLLPLDVRLVLGLLALAFVFNGGSDVVEPVLLSRETTGGRATTMTLYGVVQSLGSALAGAIGGLLLLLGGFPLLGLGLPVLGVSAAVLAWLSRPRIHPGIVVSPSPGM